MLKTQQKLSTYKKCTQILAFFALFAGCTESPTAPRIKNVQHIGELERGKGYVPAITIDTNVIRNQKVGK